MLCKHCKKEFIPKRKDSKYCSLDCNYKAKQKGQTYICPICGKDFYRKRSELRGRSTLACSVKCSSKITKNRTGTAKLTKTACETCGNEFKHRVNEFRKFCSTRCERMRTDKTTGRSQKILFNLFSQALNENGEMEYRFDDLRYKKKLPIDIFFGKSKIAIEFNGPHHYRKIGYTNEKLKLIKLRDSIKKKYLIDNEYKFIEWPYWISLSKSNVNKALQLISSLDQPSYINMADKVQRLEDEAVAANNSSTSAGHLL